MNIKTPLLLLLLPLLSTPAFAEALQAIEIGEKNACFACHSVEHQVVGPAYRDVSNRYQGDKEAAARLAHKIRTGGTGVWGQVAMPANTAISDQDLNTIVNWILAGAKEP